MQKHKAAQVGWDWAHSDQPKKPELCPAGPGRVCFTQIALEAVKRGDWRHLSLESERKSRMLGSWRETVKPH